ncbi:hypothetical protein LCGC14_3115160, partial [marine sediment metagenome]
TPDERQAIRLLQSNLLATGCVAIWPPDVLCPVLDDNDPDDRAIGLLGSAALVEAVARSVGGEAHIIGRRCTEGMRSDLAAWRGATTATPAHHLLADLKRNP